MLFAAMGAVNHLISSKNVSNTSVKERKWFNNWEEIRSKSLFVMYLSIKENKNVALLSGY